MLKVSPALTVRDSLLLEASQPFVRPKPDVEEWETRMTSLVFQFPRDPALQFYLGRAKERGGDLDGAKTAYEAALKLDDGFVPALAALAQTQMALGKVADGLATTERCVKRSPIASTCVQARFDLLFAAGECKRARDEATLRGERDEVGRIAGHAARERRRTDRDPLGERGLDDVDRRRRHHERCAAARPGVRAVAQQQSHGVACGA